MSVIKSHSTYFHIHIQKPMKHLRQKSANKNWLTKAAYVIHTWIGQESRQMYGNCQTWRQGCAALSQLVALIICYMQLLFWYPMELIVMLPVYRLDWQAIIQIALFDFVGTEKQNKFSTFPLDKEKSANKKCGGICLQTDSRQYQPFCISHRFNKKYTVKMP